MGWREHGGGSECSSAGKLEWCSGFWAYGIAAGVVQGRQQPPSVGTGWLSTVLLQRTSRQLTTPHSRQAGTRWGLQAWGDGAALRQGWWLKQHRRMVRWPVFATMSRLWRMGVSPVHNIAPQKQGLGQHSCNTERPDEQSVATRYQNQVATQACPLSGACQPITR